MECVVFKYEKCAGCSYKKVSISNTNIRHFQKKRNVSFSNTKNASFSKTKMRSFQIRKCGTFKYKNVSFLNTRKCHFKKEGTLQFSNTKYVLPTNMKNVSFSNNVSPSSFHWNSGELFSDILIFVSQQEYLLFYCFSSLTFLLYFLKVH